MQAFMVEILQPYLRPFLLPSLEANSYLTWQEK
jgi:hypothetical protein